LLNLGVIGPKLYFTCISILAITGLYYVIATRNLIRMLIGLELLSKAVMLLIIVVGNITGRIALAQSLAITMIVIEVVVMVVAAGIILTLYRKTGSIDARELTNLRG